MDLARDRLRGRVVAIHPAPGQGPAAIGPFAHQQHLLALEHRAAHVDFGRGIADLACPERTRGIERDCELARQQARNQLLQLRVALAVKRIFAERESVLRDRLHPARPLQNAAAVPLRCHGARPLLPVAVRCVLRITSFRPDQVSSTAHTLMSTRSSAKAISRITSSVMSVGTPAVRFGQLTQMAASCRMRERTPRSSLPSAALWLAKA